MNKDFFNLNPANTQPSPLQATFLRYLESIGERRNNASTEFAVCRHKIGLSMFKIYEVYAMRDSWLLRDEAIPLIMRIKPGSINAWLFASQKSDDLKERLCKHALLDVPGVLKIVNHNDSFSSWRVKPRDFIRWAEYVHIDVPAELRILVLSAEDSPGSACKVKTTLNVIHTSSKTQIKSELAEPSSESVVH